MESSEELKLLVNIFDGLTTVALAVWFVTVMIRQLSESKSLNKELIEVIVGFNSQLLRMLSERERIADHEMLKSHRESMSRSHLGSLGGEG